MTDTKEAEGDSTGVTMIRAERLRQIDEEGYSPDHDHDHVDGELALAAATYAERSVHKFREATRPGDDPRFPRLAIWPWSDEHFKPTDRLSCLVKAGALIAAEIDRLTSLEPSIVPVCSICRRERTLGNAEHPMDAYDYTPMQVVTGQPLGWYSGDDGEVCPEDMTKMIRGQ